jgi:hypothetical protein
VIFLTLDIRTPPAFVPRDSGKDLGTMYGMGHTARSRVCCRCFGIIADVTRTMVRQIKQTKPSMLTTRALLSGAIHRMSLNSKKPSPH